MDVRNPLYVVEGGVVHIKTITHEATTLKLLDVGSYPCKENVTHTERDCGGNLESPQVIN